MGKGKDKGAEDRSNPSPLPLCFPVKGKEPGEPVLNKSPIRPAPTKFSKVLAKNLARQSRNQKNLKIPLLYLPVAGESREGAQRQC